MTQGHFLPSWAKNEGKKRAQECQQPTMFSKTRLILSALQLAFLLPLAVGDMIFSVSLSQRLVIPLNCKNQHADLMFKLLKPKVLFLRTYCLSIKHAGSPSWSLVAG
jgi:hypothetical protein